MAKGLPMWFKGWPGKLLAIATQLKSGTAKRNVCGFMKLTVVTIHKAARDEIVGMSYRQIGMSDKMTSTDSEKQFPQSGCNVSKKGVSPVTLQLYD